MSGHDGELTTDGVERREFLKRAAVATGATSAVLAVGCRASEATAPSAPAVAETPKTASPTMPDVTTEPLGGFPWKTPDPFLFCVHHLDAYPAGDERMGPVDSLSGRRLGQDFSGKDGWSMYHGQVIPGFPRHPHRGFETVTVARTGYIDHSDSLGATARFGGGDAQWMTAGRGIVHAEMFPLRQRDKPNTLELFQIWINLPKANKLVPPHFTMFWHEGIPVHRLTDDAGKQTVVTTIAGAIGDRRPPSPPPDSWASRPDSDVAIWTIDLEARASWTLPAASEGVSRSLYFFEGDGLEIAGTKVAGRRRIILEPQHPAPIVAGAERCQLLLLQGRPIGEPVAQYGPFVMNTQQEIRQAFADYRRDGFGGWPWRDDAPVHEREQDRFAIHADGRRDLPG